MTNNLPTTQTRSTAIGFATSDQFEHLQRVAKMFASSDLVPEQYRGEKNLGNNIIALEMSNRIGANPMMVMQNLHPIHGRPSWSSKFIISAINTCGKFSPLRFRMEQRGKKKVRDVEITDIACTAVATELGTGEVLEGPTVTIEMAVLEGWYTKNGSKWKTMPDLMLRYRAASFFGNLYAPEILMGMQTVEEVHDIIDVTPEVVSQKSMATDLNQKISESAEKTGKRNARKNQSDRVTLDASLTEESQTASNPLPETVQTESHREATDLGGPVNDGVIDDGHDDGGLWGDDQ